jgi:hypothetical protein
MIDIQVRHWDESSLPARTLGEAWNFTAVPMALATPVGSHLWAQGIGCSFATPGVTLGTCKPDSAIRTSSVSNRSQGRLCKIAAIETQRVKETNDLKTFNDVTNQYRLALAKGDTVHHSGVGLPDSTSGCTNMFSWRAIASGLSPESRVKSCTICI